MRESVFEAVMTAPAAGGGGMVVDVVVMVVGIGVMVGIAGSEGSIRSRYGPAAHRKWSGTQCDLGRIVAEEGVWLAQEAMCVFLY